MLTIPESWLTCPKCGGKCQCYSRTLINAGGKVAMQIGMKCRACKAVELRLDRGLVTYD